jgi:hypothetical protein
MGVPVFDTRQEPVRELGQIDISVLNGAIGSHLENLQHKGGCKGFNQHREPDYRGDRSAEAAGEIKALTPDAFASEISSSKRAGWLHLMFGHWCFSGAWTICLPLMSGRHERRFERDDGRALHFAKYDQ